MNFFSFVQANPMSNVELLLRIASALVIGGVVGVEREYKSRPAGMRTHILVCLGASAVSLLESLLLSNSALFSTLHDGVGLSLGRLSAQVISGIGFLGAGTILMTSKKISGLTTAASVWNVACLGILAGFGYYWLALLLCLLVIAVLQLLARFVHINAVKHVEVKFVDRAATLPFISQYFDSIGIKVLDVDFHVEALKEPRENLLNLYTNLYTLHLPPATSYIEVVTRLSEYPNVQSVRTRNT